MNRAKSRTAVLSAAGLVLCFTFAGPVAAQVGGPNSESLDRNGGVQVDPDSLEFTILCSETDKDSLCVTTPPGGIIRAADILFVMDITGSMGEELDEVKASALDIMASIEALGIDAAYGVGTFCDYPDAYTYCGYTEQYGWEEEDFAWNMDQDVTADTSLVAGAIRALTIHNGWDLPEDYARALYETQFFAYRMDTKKIVLMFGDAPVHDCDFRPVSFGQDPGPDEIVGNGDDLIYEDVVADLAKAGIIVLSLDSSGELAGGHAFENFEYMAAQTGGGHFSLANASEIPDAIMQLISEVAVVDWLSLLIDPETPYADWCTILPDGFADVGPEETVCFEIQVSGVGVSTGHHYFDIVVDGDGEELARVPVHVYATGASATERMTWGELRKKYSDQ